MLEKTNNKLSIKNHNLHLKTLEKISEIKEKRKEQGYIEFNSYEINSFHQNLLNILQLFDEDIKTKEDIELTFVDRNKFDADLCIKIPSLLQKYKGHGYIKETIPNLIETLNNSVLKSDGIISNIETVGIYINISLSDDYLFNSLKDVFIKGKDYGENNIHQGDSIVVDYSSPNVAKHLHAGHIRSTIIGHVLSNLYNSNGYYTHRVNHINDWGGFGFFIEGYERWGEKLSYFGNKNDMLFFIYTLYRKGEKISKSEDEYNKLNNEDKSELQEYYGDFENYEEFCIKFENFVEKSKNKFKNLENGEEAEINIWEEMVEWSMQDFNKFYDLLGIHLDYLIGESFYSNYGLNLVLELEKNDKSVLYTKDLADRDINKLELVLNEEKITEKHFNVIKEEIIRDIGAYVIELENFERFVVLKGDKGSIYATRDLGAIKYRNETFSPSRVIYEVGQEQSEHFDKLFKSAKTIGINGVDFTHVYHGFYIDSKSKKKLSSRDGASNVQKLMNESIQFFKNKYKESEFSINEIDDISYKLAIGSIIFNDIKSNRKNSVLISSDIKEACQSFEESGGAYVIYSIVRAKSILAKITNSDSISFDNIEISEIDNIEKILTNQINKYPLIVKLAQENDNPATLVDFILNLSRSYNSYYNSHRVIDLEEVIEHRVIITKAFIQVSTNAMNICHIQIPNKI